MSNPQEQPKRDPQEKPAEPEAGGRKAEPTTTVPQDDTQPDTTVPQDDA